MGSKASASAGGIAFAGLLAILFIALKLTGVIAWSWWWVLAPIWISWGLIFLFLLAFFVWMALQRALDEVRR